MNLSDKIIANLGVDCAGLPLGVELSKKHAVIGFDINSERAAELQLGDDHALEYNSYQLNVASQLSYSYTARDLPAAQVFIVNVPTSFDHFPELRGHGIRALGQPSAVIRRKERCV